VLALLRFFPIKPVQSKQFFLLIISVRGKRHGEPFPVRYELKRLLYAATETLDG
jgi:hypothetical protein